MWLDDEGPLLLHKVKIKFMVGYGQITRAILRFCINKVTQQDKVPAAPFKTIEMLLL